LQSNETADFSHGILYVSLDFRGYITKGVQENNAVDIKTTNTY